MVKLILVISFLAVFAVVKFSVTQPDPNKYICTERQYAKVMKRTQDCYKDTDLNHVQCYSSAIIALCSEK